MCDPVSIGMTIASVSYSLYATRQQAKSQEAVMRAQHKEQSRQQRQQAGAEAGDRARRARAERGRLRALQAESGIAGITMDTLLRDRDFAAGQDITRIAQNQDNALRSGRHRLGANLSRIEQPDYIGAALNTGLSLYTMGQQQGTLGGSPSSTPVDYGPAPQGTSGTAPWRQSQTAPWDF